MGIFNKLFHGYFYVIDAPTLKKHLEMELNFSLDNHLEASANLYIYLQGIKHHIQIWNYNESYGEEKEKGLIIYFDEEEYKSLEELYNTKLHNVPTYFKIELIDTDNQYLNNYQKNHPELKIEDY